MSVQSGNTPPAAGTMSDAFKQAGIAAPGANAGSTAGAAQPRTAARGNGEGIVNINNRMKRPVSRTQTGELTQAFVKAFEQQFEDSMGAAFRDNYAIHVLDNSNSGLALSTILMTYTIAEAETGNHCAVFQLVVEGSGGKLVNKFVNIAGANVEIDVVAGDVVDRYQWDRTRQFLEETFGPTIKCLNAGAMLLPVELSPEDKGRIHRVVYDATQALFTVMENDVTGVETPFTVRAIDQGVALAATLDYNPTDLDSDTGLPIRSNISIITRAALATSNTAVQHEQVRDLSRVDGFIDAVFNEPSPAPYGHPQISQRYFPRFVITNCDTQVDAITPELQLFALSTATLLSKQMAWGGVFRSRYTQGPDLRDIGAIGYEVNLTPDPQAKPERVDTKADSFTPQVLYSMLQQTFNDALIYSMDIDEVGPLAWLHQVFIAAANNDQAAYKSIIDAANTLTEGHFGQLWAGGAICADDQNRVHMGYYTDGTGARRDIRDIDYVAMLNLLGDKDMPTVIAWSKTFDDTSVPLEIRLEQRGKILKALLPGMVLKGYARRVTFFPEFIVTLNQAIANNGLVIRPNNLISDFTGQTARGTYNAQGMAVNNQAIGSNLFAYTAPGGYGGRASSPFFGRYNSY